MKHGRWLFILLFTAVLIAVSGLAAGCGGPAQAQVPAQQERPAEIGLTFDSLVIERWERDRDVFVSTARSLGAEVNVQNANGDVNTQISQINYFIDKRVKAIVIIATDCDALSSVIARAHRAGIKVISYDRMISNANTDLYISFDNYKVGELMADGILSQLGDGGDIWMINGPLTDTNVPAVMQGFHDRIDGTGLTTTQTFYCEGWRPEYAAEFMDEALSQENAGIPAAIMCGNDSIAGQAIKALSERKLAGSVIVTGQDADLDACQRIVEGTQYMTVYKPVEKLAQKAAELTVDLVRKGYLEEAETVFDGTYDIPFVKLDPIPVTAQTMDEIIIGSFHQRNEEYLNVDSRAN